MRNRGQANKRSLMAGVYYRLPNQHKNANELLFLQLQEKSCLQTLVQLGDFNDCDIYWESSTASSKYSSRVLENNFLIQVIDTLTRRALLDLLLTNPYDLIREIRIGGSMGCSDHTLIIFMISRGKDWVKNKVKTFNFKKANFHLSKEMVNTIPWEGCFTCLSTRTLDL